MAPKLPKGYTKFDAADYLKNEEDMRYFLEAAMEGNDAAHIARALEIIESSNHRIIGSSYI